MTEALWLLPPVWRRWGRWAVSRSVGGEPGQLLSVGYVLRFDAASYEPCGLRVSLGRRSWSLFAVSSREAYRAGAPWRLESEEFKPLRRGLRGGGEVIRMLGLGRLKGGGGVRAGRFAFTEEREPGERNPPGDVSGRMLLVGGVGFALLRVGKSRRS